MTALDIGTASPSPIRRLLASAPWFGIGIVVVVAAVNSTRRTINALREVALADWLVMWAESWLETTLMGLIMIAAVVAAVHRFPRAGRAQYSAVGTAVVLSTFAASVAALAWESHGTFDLAHPTTGPMTPAYAIFVDCLRYGVLAALIAGAFVYFRSERESASTAHACNMDAERLDEQASQARLQVLEAQIEPHFLFNALATVKRLFQTNPATGERMLANMMRYLSIALPHIRAGDSTVRREATLAEAYLEIQQIRMGNRLAFRVEVPDGLGDATLPALMLPTLVENAIKHGIGPLPQGGTIVIRARAESGTLRVEVADDGRGFVASSGGGTGLANLRARLTARFGANGALTLTPAEPAGLTVAIILPLAFGTPSP